jgi:ligand-binding sensor domain-containing protein/signal transduction histidine kinase/DNA-binding response OmpR family regulator
MNSVKYKLSLIVFFIFTLAIFKAQSTLYHREFQRSLSVVDGLASNEVNCILQDKKGFMWFGTNNGLSRFDGYVFKTYKSNYRNPDFFTNNNIRSIAEDQSGCLWIGTNQGVNKFNLITGEITKFEKSSIQSFSINAIVIGVDNTPYFGTTNGLFYYDRKNEKFIQIAYDSKKRPIHVSYIRSLYIDSKNYLWIGSWETGYEVLNLNTNVFSDYPYLKDKKQLIINYIFEDSNGNIWLSTWDKYGVCRIENPHQPAQSKLTVFYPQKSKSSEYYPVVYAINQNTNNGDILLATPHGIQIINEPFKLENTVFLTNENSIKLSDSEIYALYKDRTGIMWYSIFGLGLNALNTNRKLFNQNNLTEMLNENMLQSSITSIYEDASGLLWLGIKSLILGIFDPQQNKLTLYNEHPVLKSLPTIANSVFCFLSPSKFKNELWIGTRYEGLFILKLQNNKVISVERKIIPNVDPKNLGINYLAEDSENKIWIATNRGLFRTELDSNGKYQFVNKKLPGDLALNQVINCILIDDSQNMWIGTRDRGLYKMFSDGKLKNLIQFSKEKQKLNSNEVTSLLQDYKKRIWVGTKGGGVSLFNSQRNEFQIIENMSLIPDDAVYSMQEDNWGNIWFGTGNGLVNYNHDLPIDQRIRLFTANEGNRISTFNANSSFKNNKNELFFGGTNGLVSFVPEKNQTNSVPPQPVITGVSIANELVDNLPLKQRSKISKNQIPYTDKVTLNHNQQNILIEFSSLVFDNISAVKYAYQLDGVDKDWVYVDSKKRFVNYNNLAAGIYLFKIKAANAQGIWNDTPTTLKIRVKPAPWKTVYAYMFYLILFAAIVFMTSRFVMNRLRLKKMLALEHIEREKSEEVHQAKLKFFTNISHEFFTPITILKCSIDSLANKYRSDTQTFSTMEANMERLIRLLEQVVDFRKVETGNMRIKVREVEIVAFIRDLCDIHFSPLSKQQNIALKFETEQSEIIGFVDTDKLDKIIYNLLSNAFKYNIENGSVIVKIAEVDDNFKRVIKLSVSDTGVGMSDEFKQNIFKRFYEGNFRNFKVKSFGIGLSLIYDLIQLHKGDIKVDSTVGKGTTFYVTLPINRENYSENEIYQDAEILNIQNVLLTEESTKDKSVDELINSVLDKKLTLLFVEDNADLADIVCEALENEYHILKAFNGNEALDILRVNVVDIVVTDVLMPDMNGVELTQMMKSMIEFSHIPIIILSAKQNLEQKVEGYNAGADSYITKPFEMPALVANIRSLLRNRKLLADSFSNENGLLNISKFAHNNTDKEFLEKVKLHIEKNVLLQDFSTNDLYAEMNMSQSTFYRKLHSLIGLSPNELIRKVKIDVACRLLTENNLNISEIAYNLGFNDPKYFSNIFKKETGLSPSEFIRQSKSKLK